MSTTASRYDNCCYYSCHTLLLTIIYFLIILIVSMLNTVTWITEIPLQNVYHHESLYAIRKGFNVFFVMTVLITIVIICYQIGDQVLRIPNLKIRSHYNFFLLMISLVSVIAIPILFMLIFVYLVKGHLRPALSVSFLLQVLINFCAINAIILFVFFDFLLLTALLSTLRSYNIFKHLSKIRLVRGHPAKVPLLPQQQIPYKKPPRYPPFYSRLRQQVQGPPGGAKRSIRRAHPLQTVPEMSTMMSPSLRTASIRSIGAASRRMQFRLQPSILGTSSIYSSYSPLPSAVSMQSQPFQFINRHLTNRGGGGHQPHHQRQQGPRFNHQLDYPYDYQQDMLLDNDPAGSSIEHLPLTPSSPTMSSAYHYFPSSTRNSSLVDNSSDSSSKKLTPSVVHYV